MSEFLNSADSRETDKAVMEAILAVAGGNEVRAERIWEDPSESEALAIWERVTKNGLISSSEFCWGAAGCLWADELGLEMQQASLAAQAALEDQA